MDGIGPIDPALARDLARATATNPKTTWCVTVTDEQGHATGHGCARPEPANHTRPAGRPGAGPACRRPSATCDFEHNIPYEAGGRSCLCNGGPKCRYDHRLKQDPRWRVEQITPGT